MSDTYKSRVFTFISKRTNRLKDSCAQGLRHLKVAVVWTGQILLYPLHLLAQSTKLFHPELPTSRQQPALPQPNPHLSIEQALDFIADAEYPIHLSGSSIEEIDHRNELVAEDWSVIDENIWNTGYGNTAIASREIVNTTSRDRRVTSAKPVVRGMCSLLSNRSIALVTTENEILNILNTTQQQEIRRRIGIDLAVAWHQWQHNRFDYNPDRELLADRSPSPQLAIGSSTITEPNLLQRWQNWLESLKDRSPTAESQIELAAIDNIAPKSQLKLPAANYSFTPQPPQFDRFIELPQLPPVIEDRVSIDRENLVIDTLAKLPPEWLKRWWNYYRDYLYIPPQDNSDLVHQPQDFQLIPIEPASQKGTIRAKIDRQDASSLVVNKPIEISTSRSHQDLKFNTQDWIEAESEDLGHSRSLIASILMWLDSMMLKIENWLIKIWEFITNNPAQN